uniref:Prolyl 4-hydroxylase alpha subunit domain-containing protein n=1 Tax=Alexandrium monilatum TaxID=311494 RepID=A0A7S4VMX8_9DINO
MDCSPCRHWMRSLALSAGPLQGRRAPLGLRPLGISPQPCSQFDGGGSSSGGSAASGSPPGLLTCALAVGVPRGRWLLLGRGVGAGPAQGVRRAAATVSEASRPTVDVVSGEPLVLAVDGLCPEERVAELRALVDQQSADDRIHTSAYVDDMFEERRSLEEDAHLLRCVASGGVRAPREYCLDPLRSFLWAAATSWDRLPREQESLRLAQLAVARRAWQTQWDPEDIARSGFRKAATRWKVPETILRRLAPLVVDVLAARVHRLPGCEEALAAAGGGAAGPDWVLRDSTVVRYRPGESQVPHMDTCDLTLLIYLSSSGGPTCFPVLGRQVPPRAGRVLLFFSTIPEATRFGGFADAAYGRPNEATMHYGGLAGEVAEEEKLVVQLLLSAEGLGSASSWNELLKGRLFREAALTKGQQSMPLVPGDDQAAAGQRGRLGLALSTQRCAKGCVGRALEMETEEGGPKHCIWCWSSWLERSIASGRPEAR